MVVLGILGIILAMSAPQLAQMINNNRISTAASDLLTDFTFARATAVTRGLNGNIPPRVDSLTQVPATLVEWHDKPQRTEFNIFASQGDGRRIMQSSTVKVMNRKIDQDILGMLSGASSTLGAAQSMTLALATRALAHLDLQDVDTTEEDNMFFVGSPAMRAYLMQIPEFQKAEYVEIKPLAGPARRFRRWAGFNWIFHPHLPNVGTSSEQCFAFHRASARRLVPSAIFSSSFTEAKLFFSIFSSCS